MKKTAVIEMKVVYLLKAQQVAKNIKTFVCVLVAVNRPETESLVRFVKSSVRLGLFHIIFCLINIGYV